MKKASFRGNLSFASVNALSMKTTSRRDDLISLFYFLAYLSLKEQFIFNTNQLINDEGKFEFIRELKKAVSVR